MSRASARGGHGPANMALDEALLETVSAGGAATAFLRTYGWTTPTLSLGYFQHLDRSSGRSALSIRPDGAPVDRRRSDLASPRGDLRSGRRRPIIRWRGPAPDCIAQSTRPSRGPARVGNSRGPARRICRERSYGDQKRPLLCFTDPDPEDIVTNGVKIVGSAQRRRGGAVLQHGSLLLARSCRTPELLGVCDVADESRGES